MVPQTLLGIIAINLTGIVTQIALKAIGIELRAEGQDGAGIVLRALQETRQSI